MSFLLVATDGSDSAKAATRLALELAAASGDRLLFVTAWHELRGDFGIPLHHLIPDLLEIERDWANETLAAAAAEAKAAGVDAETISRHGSAADEICAVARARRPRMIVLGTHGWRLIEGVLFGSVSTGVLQHAPCPVLVVPGPATTRYDQPTSVGAPTIAARSGRSSEAISTDTRTEHDHVKAHRAVSVQRRSGRLTRASAPGKPELVPLAYPQGPQKGSPKSNLSRLQGSSERS